MVCRNSRKVSSLHSLPQLLVIHLSRLAQEMAQITASASAVLSSSLIGACYPNFAKVPESCVFPSSFSTFSIKGILVVRELPLMMNAFELEEGRQERRWFLIVLVP